MRQMAFLAGITFAALMLACTGEPAGHSRDAATTAPGRRDAATSDAGTAEAGNHDGGDDSPCAVPENAHPSVGPGRARGYRCDRISAPLHAPRDVMISRTGQVYVTEMGAGRIVRLIEDGAGAASFAVVAEGLVAPIGLREDADGNLLVAEEHRQSVARIDPGTGQRTVVADGLHAVTYLAIGPEGTAFVSSFVEVAATGTGIVWRIDLASGAASPFIAGLHVPEGLFFASNRLGVVEFQAPSAALSFGLAGGMPADAATLTTDLSGAYGLSEDGHGGVLVGDHAGRILQVHAGGSSEVLLDDIGRPGGITLAADGTVWIAEFVDFGATGYLIRLVPD